MEPTEESREYSDEKEGDSELRQSSKSRSRPSANKDGDDIRDALGVDVDAIVNAKQDMKCGGVAGLDLLCTPWDKALCRLHPVVQGMALPSASLKDKGKVLLLRQINIRCSVSSQTPDG